MKPIRIQGAVAPSRSSPTAPAAAPGPTPSERGDTMVDLERRRDQLKARVAELQWDLGGLTYEMATRNHIRVEVLVKRAAILQDADAELQEIERIRAPSRPAPPAPAPPAALRTAAARSSAGSAARPLLFRTTASASRARAIRSRTKRACARVTRQDRVARGGERASATAPLTWHAGDG